MFRKNQTMERGRHGGGIVEGLRAGLLIVASFTPMIWPASGSSQEMTAESLRGSASHMRYNSGQVSEGRISACKVVRGNGSGSGVVVGHDDDSTYVLTNAHVVGSRIGAACQLIFDINGKTTTYDASVVAAAYMSRQSTDWAVVETDVLVPLPDFPMSKTLPKFEKHRTCGSPRGVWPLVCGIVSPENKPQLKQVWYWSPNAIPGQSGSGICRTNENLTEGLLTWSSGGSGAGQTTATIFSQVQNRTADSNQLPANLQPLGEPTLDLVEGYFEQSSIRDLPIWAPEIVSPPSSTETLSEAENRLIQSVRLALPDSDVRDKVISEFLGGGMADDMAIDSLEIRKQVAKMRARGIDFQTIIRLIELILKLLEEFE